MKKIVLVVLAFISLQTFAQKQVISDPNVQQRNVSEFHALRVSHAIDVMIVQGNEEGLAVSARTVEIRDRIKSEVRNGVLIISYDEPNWNNSGGNKKLKAYVSVKNLDAIKASGACDVIINGKLETKELTLDFSGASDFKGTINTEFLDVDISGASDVTVNGNATSAQIHASGASDFKGYELVTEKSAVHASGASDIKITVNKELNAEASGASGINYRGEGLIKDIKTSGASSVSRKG